MAINLAQDAEENIAAGAAPTPVMVNEYIEAPPGGLDQQLPDYSSVQDNEYVDLEAPTRKDILDRNLLAAQADDSARIARVQKLAKDTGLPVGLVDRNLEDIQRATEPQIDTADLDKNDPQLAQWLENPENVSLAKEDIDPLRRMARGIRLMAAKPDDGIDRDMAKYGVFAPVAGLGLGQAYDTGMRGLEAGTYLMGAAYGHVRKETVIPSIAEAVRQQRALKAKAPDYSKEFNAATEGITKNIQKDAQRMMSAWPSLKQGKILEALKSFAVGEVRTVGDLLDLTWASMQRPRGAAYGVVENLPNSLPSLALGGAGALAAGPGGFIGGSFMGSLFSEVGSTAMESMEKRGFDTGKEEDLYRAFADPNLMEEIRGEALRKGLGTAVVDMFFNAFAGKMVGMVPKTSPVQHKVAAGLADVGLQAFGEGFSEGTGQLAKTGDIKKVDFGEMAMETMMSLGQSVGDTAIGVHLDSPDTALIPNDRREKLDPDPAKATEELTVQAKEAIQVIHTAQAMAEAGEAAKQLKNVQQVPGKIAELVDEVTGGKGASNVLFQVDEWDEHWNKQNLSPVQAVEQITGDPHAYHEAVETGTPIQIPMGQFVEKVVLTPQWETLLQITRTEANGQSLGEARETIKQLPVVLNQLAQEAKSPREPSEKQVLTQELARKFERGGRSKYEAQAHAQNEVDQLAIRAGIRGMGVREYYDLYPLEVNQGQQAVTTPDERVLHQVIDASKRFGNKKSKTKRKLKPLPPGFQMKTSESGQFEVYDSDGILRGFGKSAEKASENFHKGNKLEGRSLTVSELLAIEKEVDEISEANELADPNRDQDVIDNNMARLDELIEILTVSHAVAMENEKKKTFEQSGLPAVIPPSPTVSPLGFYSQVEAEVLKMDFKSIPAGDLANRLRGIQGLKKEEFEWMGLLEWLDARAAGQLVVKTADGGTFGKTFPTPADAEKFLDEIGKDGNETVGPQTKVTKEEVLAFVQNNGLQIRQVVLADSFNADLVPKLLPEPRTNRGDNEAILDTDLSWDDGEAQEPDGDRISEDADYYLDEGREMIGEERWDEQVKKHVLEKIQDELDLPEDFDLDNVSVKWVKNPQRTWTGSYKITGVELTEGQADSLIESAEEHARDYYRDTALDMANDSYWNGDSRNMRYVESETNYYLEGTEDGDYWYCPDNQKSYQGNIEEAKIKLLQDMIDEGIVETQEMRDERESESEEPEDSQTDEPIVPRQMYTMPIGPKPLPGVNEPSRRSKWSSYIVEGGENYREFLLTVPELKGGTFKAGVHWGDIENPVLHVRTTDRTDVNGVRTLVIEEMQSDLHQEGREKGYRGDVNKEYEELLVLEKALEAIPDDVISEQQVARLAEVKARILEVHPSNAIPDAPHKNTDSWSALAFKRMLRLAVEEGFDAVAWMPAEVHVDRWGTDSISWHKKEGVLYEANLGGDTATFDSRSSAVLWMGRHQYTSRMAEGGYEVIRDKTGQRVGFYTSLDQAAGAIDGGYFRSEGTIKEKSDTHFLVGTGEQVGGNAGGVAIEEQARARGHLLERKGERVTTKEELKKVVKETLHREHGDRSLENLTESIWKAMQEKDSGVKAPRKEGMEFFYDNLLPKKVVPAILKKLDKSAKVGVTKFITDGNSMAQDAWTVQLTDDAKEKIKQGFTLFQDEARGQIELQDKQAIMTMFPGKSDVSTVVHEGAHYWLERTRQDIAHLKSLPTLTAAQSRFLADGDEILKFLGVTDWSEIKRDQHEKYARAFELYRRGPDKKGPHKAPTPGLQRMFNQFRAWLVQKYKSAKMLNVELTPEITQVFDRMVATEEELATAAATLKPITDDPAAFGFTGDKAERYITAREEARTAAENQLNSEVQADFKRRQTAVFKEQRRQIREEEAARVNQIPVYTAIALLKEGAVTDGVPFKLDRSQVDKELLKQMPRGVTAKKGEPGIHPDIAAEFLGFKSGEELVLALANAIPADQVIEQATNDRMNNEHPDLLTDEELPEHALQAIHNDKRAKLLRMELEHLAANDPTILKEAGKKVAKRVPSEKAIREQATRTVARMIVSDIKPHKFQRAEVRAAKEAAEAFAKGDMDGAFEAKRRELLNHELYRASVDAQKKVDRSMERFKRVAQSDEKISRSRDVNVVAAARSLLARYGIGKEGKSAESYLAAIEKYDPNAHEALKNLLDQVAPEAKPVSDLSFDDFVALSDTVDALWSYSRSLKEVELEGKRVDFNETKEEIIAAIREKTSDHHRKLMAGTVPESEEGRRGFLGFLAQSRRFESWARAMDDGNSDGIFTRLYRNISQASLRHRQAKQATLKKLVAIIRPISKSFTMKPIVAKELGPNGFTFRNGKVDILGALLHIGNSSNKTKLLVGYGWGTVDENGVLDSRKWDEFFDRMQAEGVITKEDMDAVQAMWDLFEETKPDAQKVHKDLYGYYFNEITQEPVTTRFGTYRGGYAPARPDPMRTAKADERKDEASVDQQYTFQYPTTGRGHTKNRTEGYNVPLLLDLRLMETSLDAHLRFIHLEPAVKNVARLMMDREVSQAMLEMNPIIMKSLISPWLQRSALQRTMQPPAPGDESLHKHLRTLRSRTGMIIMFGNLSNTAQNFTGFGPALAMVKGKYLRSAGWSYLQSPKKTTAWIASKSQFMAGRMDNQTSVMRRDLEKLLSHPNPYENAKSWTSLNTYILQSATQNIVDSHVWAAAYEQATAEGMADSDAVQFADSVIRQTQSSSNPEDVSSREAGTAGAAIFNQFQGYLNTQANLGITTGQIIRSTSESKAEAFRRTAALYLSVIAVPTILSAMIGKAAGGGDWDEDDDDSYLDDFLKMATMAQVNYLLGMIPIYGQAASIGVKLMNDKPYDDRLSTPVTQTVEQSLRAPFSVYKAVAEDGDQARAVRDAFSLFTLATGLPFSLVARPLGYLLDVKSGKAQPTGPLDYSRGLVTGRPGANSTR